MEIKGHKLIFKTLVGSQMYGTAVPESDKDYKGIYIQDPANVYVNGYKEQIEVSKDEVYYEVGRFLSLCSTGNPTMLELLYAPEECIEYQDSIWKDIVAGRDIFITKSLRYSFGGYAIEQIKKAGGLQKKMNWENNRIERKTVTDFCWIYPVKQTMDSYQSEGIRVAQYLKDNNYKEEYCGLVKIEHMRDCFLLFCDDLAWVKDAGERHGNINTHDYRGITSGESSNEVCLSEVPKYCTPRAVLFFNRDAYSIHCKEYREYQQWLNTRNTQRYVDIENHGQRIDGKNILHCIRLIETALEIPVQKKINVQRPNAQYLIEIRRGKHDLKTLLEKCERDLQQVDESFKNSDLPDKVDKKKVEEYIKKIKQNYYEYNRGNK